MTFLRHNFSSINLYDQLRQRESNLKLQSQPHIFKSYLFRERLRVAKNLYKTDLVGHFGCVNAVEFAHGGKFLASGGDDKRVLVWDIEKSLANIGKPRVLDSEHASNIFCLGFDSQNRKIISGGNDDLVISHDFETGKLDNVFKQDNPVYGLSIDPHNDSIFATASESGKILLFDQRKDPISSVTIADKPSSFHAVEFHPHSGNLLVTANSRFGAALYDIRKPIQSTIDYMQAREPRSCMSVRFNRSGSLILALRRRLSPILYKTDSSEPVCTFHNKNYYNSCTMKSCTFAGEDDELIISGSDDFNLYIWRISDVDLDCIDQEVEQSQMVLYGHRSIVNQVRYNYQKCLLASSGVEKIVKIWSPFSQNNWSGSLLNEATCSDNPREVFYPFFGSVMSVASMSHDYSTRNTNEDPRMLAFFDTLLRQEIEGSEPNSSTDSSMESDETSSNFNLSLDSSSTSDSDTSYTSTSDSDDDDDNSDDNDDDDNNDNMQSLAVRVSHSRNNKRIMKPKLITKRRMTVLLKRRHLPFQHLKRIFRIRSVQQKQKQKPKQKVRQKQRQQQSYQQSHHQNHKKRIRYLSGTSKRKRTVRSLNSSGHQRSHSSSNMCADFWRIDSDRPTTSAAAAAASSLSSRKKRNHKQKKKLTLSSSFDLSNLSVSSGDNTSSTTTAPGTTNNSTISNNNNNNNNANSNNNNNNNNNNANSNNNNNNNNNNVAEPSTSTGITTSLRDNILCLRRQQQLIIDSDEDDDEDNQNTYNNKNPLTNDTQRRDEPRKLNGLQNDIDVTVVAAGPTPSNTSYTSSHRPLRTYQGPKNSAALNIDTNHQLHQNHHQVLAINRTIAVPVGIEVTAAVRSSTTTTTLPQRHSINNENLRLNSPTSGTGNDYDQQNNAPTAETATTTTITSTTTTANTTTRISNKRHKLAERKKQKSNWNISELYSSHNNNNHDDHDNVHSDSNANDDADDADDDDEDEFNDRNESAMEDELILKVNDTSSEWRNYQRQRQQYHSRHHFKLEEDDEDASIPYLSPTILPSPAKRRKISIADYIKKRQRSNECVIDVNNGEDNSLTEENNNEQNNNDININEPNRNENINMNGQQTPPRQISSNFYHHHSHHRRHHDRQHHDDGDANGNSNGNQGGRDLYDDHDVSLSLAPAHIYFTPDSGISLTNSNTPSSAGHVMMYNNYNHYNDAAASTSRAANRLMPSLETDESNNGDNALDSLVNNNNNNNNNNINSNNNINKNHNNNNNSNFNIMNNNNNNNNKSKQSNMTVFKKKVARIRRNYVRKFNADDSESD